MRRITFLPKTPLGWCSVTLTVAFILFYVLFLIYAAFVLSMAALLTGVVSIIKSKDWSVLVFVATLVGLLVLFYVLVIVLFAHGTSTGLPFLGGELTLDS